MMKIQLVLEFTYNGKFRKVRVEKDAATYIQGWNMHNDAGTRGATYSKAKMKNVKTAIEYVQ